MFSTKTTYTLSTKPVTTPLTTSPVMTTLTVPVTTSECWDYKEEDISLPTCTSGGSQQCGSFDVSNNPLFATMSVYRSCIPQGVSDCCTAGNPNYHTYNGTKDSCIQDGSFEGSSNLDNDPVCSKLDSNDILWVHAGKATKGAESIQCVKGLKYKRVTVNNSTVCIPSGWTNEIRCEERIDSCDGKTFEKATVKGQNLGKDEGIGVLMCVRNDACAITTTPITTTPITTTPIKTTTLTSLISTSFTCEAVINNTLSEEDCSKYAADAVACCEKAGGVWEATTCTCCIGCLTTTTPATTTTTITTTPPETETCCEETI